MNLLDVHCYGMINDMRFKGVGKIIESIKKWTEKWRIFKERGVIFI